MNHKVLKEQNLWAKRRVEVNAIDFKTHRITELSKLAYTNIKHIDQWKGIEPRYTSMHLINGFKTNTVSSVNDVGESKYSHEGIKLDFPTLFIKINSNYFEDLNTRSETVVRNNIKNQLFNNGLSKFFGYSTRSIGHRSKKVKIWLHQTKKKKTLGQ